MTLHSRPGGDVPHVAVSIGESVGVGVQHRRDQRRGAAGGWHRAIVTVLFQLSGVRKIPKQIFDELPLARRHWAAPLQLLYPFTCGDILHIPGGAAGLDVTALLNQPDH